MSADSGRKIDFTTKVKRFFSSSKLSRTSSLSEGGQKDMERVQAQPSKPQRKSIKARSPPTTQASGSKDDRDVVDTEKLPAVHRQGGGAGRRCSQHLELPSSTQDILGPTNKGSRKEVVGTLAEVAQLTIFNQRLSKENQALRRQNQELLYKANSSENLDGFLEDELRYAEKNISGGAYNSEEETLDRLRLDRELLENLVWRLNVELGRYETKLQQYERARSPVGHKGGTTSPAPTWCRADPATIKPLLVAYDEALAEKQHLLSTYELKLQELSAELRELVEENERLHEVTEMVARKESQMKTDNIMLQKDVQNLNKENAIIMEQLELFKDKNDALTDEFQIKMSQIQEQEAAVAERQVEIKVLSREYSILEERLAETEHEMEQRIPAKHHHEAIAECRHLLDELKINYNKDRQVLEERNKALLIEKVQAEAQTRSLTSETNQQEARIRALEKLLRRMEARNEHLQTRLVGAESCRDSSVRELRQLMAVAERLTSDQEALLQQLQTQQGANRRLSALRSSLKTVQKELPEIERQLRAQESGVERMKGDHQREVVKLRALLRQKDQAIKQLQHERNSTCEQLEMVWKATGNESLIPAEKDPGNFQLSSLPETHRKICQKQDM